VVKKYSIRVRVSVCSNRLSGDNSAGLCLAVRSCFRLKRGRLILQVVTKMSKLITSQDFTFNITAMPTHRQESFHA
jgi:hypothetical protein